jgi:5-hydroxyisourate hydrolase-like protein (transthyretin family)
MSKLPSSIYSIGLLSFIFFLTFCHKEEVKSVSESPKPITLYTQNAKDGKSEPDVFITLQKKVANQVDSFENVLEIGKTDASGKLIWNYDKTALPTDHRFACNKSGFWPSFIPISDLSKREFQGYISQLPDSYLSFHIVSPLDGKPAPDVVIILQKKVPNTSNTFEDVAEIGKTDAAGNLAWDYGQIILNSDYRFIGIKSGFEPLVFPVTIPLQHDFQGIMKTMLFPVSFYITDSKYGQPMPDAEISLFVKNLGFIDKYDYVSTIGKTDSNGKLIWNHNQDSISKYYRFSVKKPGYYETIIKVPDSYQNDFSGALGQYAKINFHLKYDNDTIKKRFIFYYGIHIPPAENHVYGGYFKRPILFLPKSPSQDYAAHIDTTFTLDIESSYAPQDFHCVIVDPSYFVNSSLNFEPFIPHIDLIVPAYAKDTTYLFEAFW